jgi:hypothetical protein
MVPPAFSERRPQMTDRAGPAKGWIALPDLLATVPGANERNLREWRRRGLVPFEPAHLHIAGKAGSVSFYPPETVPLLRRLIELRRESDDANRWCWGLWIDGYPVDIKTWAIELIVEHEQKMLAVNRALDRREATESAEPLIAPAATTGGRVRSRAGLKAITEHVLAWGRDSDRPDLLTMMPEPLPEATYLDLLATGMGLPGHFESALAEALGLGMPYWIAQLHRVLVTTEEQEIERARRDWQAIATLQRLAATIDWNRAPALALPRTKPEPSSWAIRKAKRIRPRPMPDLVRWLIPFEDDRFSTAQRAQRQAIIFASWLYCRRRMASTSVDRGADQALGMVGQWMDNLPRLLPDARQHSS